MSAHSFSFSTGQLAFCRIRISDAPPIYSGVGTLSPDTVDDRTGRPLDLMQTACFVIAVEFNHVVTPPINGTLFPSVCPSLCLPLSLSLSVILCVFCVES